MALSGAPRKESGLTRQLLVGVEDEVLYFKLPGAKKKKKYLRTFFFNDFF